MTNCCDLRGCALKKENQLSGGNKNSASLAKNLWTYVTLNKPRIILVQSPPNCQGADQMLQMHKKPLQTYQDAKGYG